MLVSKEIDFVPSVAAIVMSAISRASKKLLIADCVHWVTNLCALSVMQKTGNILVRYKKKKSVCWEQFHWYHIPRESLECTWTNKKIFNHLYIWSGPKRKRMKQKSRPWITVRNSARWQQTKTAMTRSCLLSWMTWQEQNSSLKNV